MADEGKCKLGALATICCKTGTAVEEYDGKIPSTKATKADDIFALGMIIWMVGHRCYYQLCFACIVLKKSFKVFQGKEPWSGPRAPRQVLNRAHRGLPKPDDMKDRLWGTLQSLLCQDNSQIPTVEVVKQRLGEEITVC